MERMMHVIPDESYREQVIEYVQEHLRDGSHMNGAGGLGRYVDDYDGWLQKIANDRNVGVTETTVPAETYMLVRESDNRLVGMCNIRTQLNDALRNRGGNIGYGIRPSERRKGYNEINLYLALVRCQELGLDVVLLDCRNNNIGSYKTMEALGGILLDYYDDEEEGLCRRYMINVDEAINTYRNIYEPRIRRR